MDKKNQKNNEDKKINLEKFSTHKGEFVPVTEEVMKNKTVTTYAEFVEDDETG